MWLKLINWITLALFSSERPSSKTGMTKWVLFFLPVLSLLLICGLSFILIYNNLTKMVFDRREAISQMASFALQERFDRIMDVGQSLASRIDFRDFVSQERWKEAAQIQETIPMDHRYIDRIFIANPKGIEMADTPSLPGAVGRDFSFRDWYKGVSRNWTPYLSLIYKRAASPRYNVIAAAFPIKHTTTQEILGILVLQIRLDILYAWSEEIKVGDKGLLYFVDPEGNVAGHPGFWAQGEITNFSTLPFVQKTLKGNHGVQFSRDTLQHHKTLVAFAPVKKYGWGVVVEEPLESAFGSRNQTLWVLILIYTLILILNSFTARFIEKVFTVLEKQRQIIKEAMQ